MWVAGRLYMSSWVYVSFIRIVPDLAVEPGPQTGASTGVDKPDTGNSTSDSEIKLEIEQLSNQVSSIYMQVRK